MMNLYQTRAKLQWEIEETKRKIAAGEMEFIFPDIERPYTKRLENTEKTLAKINALIHQQEERQKKEQAEREYMQGLKTATDFDLWSLLFGKK